MTYQINKINDQIYIIQMVTYDMNKNKSRNEYIGCENRGCNFK